MQFDQLRRREFITLLGGAVAAWPLAARAQQGERMRRIGLLTGGDEADPEYQARFAVLRQALQQLGWTEGYNIRFDFRWGSSDSDLALRYARELVALAPDIILPSGSQNVRAVQQATRTVLIVFVKSPIRSAPALSQASHAPAATPPASRRSNTACSRNCWSCSKRSLPA
jgi:hypothetical protein